MLARPTLPFLLVFLAVGCGHSSERPAPTCPPRTVIAAPPASTPSASAPPATAAPRLGEIPLDLPKASEFSAKPATPGPGQVETMSPILLVTITKDGQMYVDSQVIANADALLSKATELKTRDPDIRVVIQADRATSWGNVVLAIDACKRGGVSKIAFAVQVQ